MAYPNLDAELVNTLLNNGRASLRGLGEDLDVSVTTVSNHLEDLKESGRIKGFSPVIDYNEWGYNTQAIINITVEGSELTEFTDRLKDHNNITSIYETTGDFDVVAVGVFENTDHMNDEIKSLLDDDAVQDTNTNVVLNSVRNHEQFDIPVDDSE